MKKLLLIGLVGLVLASPALQINAQEGNLLVNPGFESPYPQQVEAIAVAYGWTAWWVEPDSSTSFPSYCDYSVAPPSCQPYHRPEYGMAFPYGERIRTGGNAQKYFSFFSTHLAGVYQQVTGVTPGQAYRFTVYVMTWSTNQDKGFTSAVQPSMGVQIGIDPNGGTDPFNANIVWSQSQNAFDVWNLIGVEAPARSSTITVFTRSWPQLALQHNDVYLDDAGLVAIGAADPSFPTSPPLATGGAALPGLTIVPPTALFITSTPIPSGEVWYTVQPGDTLVRIAFYHQTTVDELKRLNSLTSNTIYSNQKLLAKVLPPPAPATATPGPTLTPSLTPALVQFPTNTSAPFALSPDYGQLCVVAYNDANRNAVYDDEPTLSDVRVTLSVGSTPLDGYITTGTEATHCFPQMPSGSYTVSVASPAGYTTTTASEAAVQLQAGNLVTLAFGLASVIDSPAEAPPETPLSGMTVFLLGVGALTVVMAGVGGVAFLLVKKR
jgi:LysM repeat protein